MAHMRQRIREGVEGLIAAIANIETVYSSRVRSINESALPAVVIYTNAEQTADEGNIINSTSQRRILTLKVEIRAKGELIDDVLDQLCVDVEKALGSDVTLGGFATDSELSETEIEFDSDTDNDVGLATLTYDVAYRTDTTDPELLVI